MAKLGRPPVDPVVRFNSKVKNMENGCIEFTGAKNKDGYGQFYINETIGNVMAHRFSFELSYGKIPEGLIICHKCDNPKCVNIDHLFLGTHKDNSDDKINKGRFKSAYTNLGNHPNSILSVQDVKEIKNLINIGLRNIDIARKFNISHKLVSLIRLGKRWAWLDNTELKQELDGLTLKSNHIVK